MTYPSLEQMGFATFDAVRPPEPLTVVEAAQKYVIIRQPGAHVGPWSAEKTPYLIEPQEVLTSLDYTGMIFVSPARTGKSQAFQNWLAHSVKCDPTDMMLIHMAQHTAREWSKDELEKLHRNSPEIAAQLLPGRNNDNTFDKEYLSGMRLTITWPTANNLSGKTKRYVWIMDYDRIADTIDNEGNTYDLAKVRTRTFKRFGMAVAESSPGREVENPKWLAKTPHEAPPTKGILELYNRGDRRRWYWKCPQCADTFEPSFGLLSYPESQDPMESAEQVCLPCPSCGFPIEPSMKDALNGSARWVKDGMLWLPDGRIVQREDMSPARSDIASFWLRGPAAAFQDWSGLVLEYLRAVKAYEATGDEEPLRKTTNTDQGEPYIPRRSLSDRTPEDMKARAEDWGSTEKEPTVPPDGRFLVATVDVQKGGFVVQVSAGTSTGDLVKVDAFRILKSERLDGDGDPLPADPAGYPEDWDLLIEGVMERTYALPDGSGRRMRVRQTGCDSGGREGVTFNAYAFWRRLKKHPKGLHRSFALIKGDGAKTAPRAQVTWPDSNQRGTKAAAVGDVPVIRLNSNLLKDQVSSMLARRVSEETDDVGGGMIRYPDWVPGWYYSQMTTEIRTAEKGWENPAKKRNEAWDLTYYALGLLIRPPDIYCPLVTFAAHRIDWSDPPHWARAWDHNSMVEGSSGSVESDDGSKKTLSLAELGNRLA